METDFPVEYYIQIVDLFCAKALEFELVGDKFFALQQQTGDLSDEAMQVILDHPQYAALAWKLEQIEAVIAKLK